MTDHVSNPYKITGTVVVLRMLFIMGLLVRGRDKIIKDVLRVNAISIRNEGSETAKPSSKDLFSVGISKQPRISFSYGLH